MYRVFKKDLRFDKFLPCMLIAMVFVMFIYGSNVYASVDFSVDDIDYTYPDPPIDSSEYPYTLYYKTTDPTCFRIFYSSTPFYFKTGVSTLYTDRVTLMNDYCHYIIYKPSTNSYKYVEAVSNYKFKNYDNQDILNNEFQSSYGFSQNEFYNDKGELVFQLASQELAKTTMISTQMTSVDFSLVLKEVLEMLLIVLPVVILVIALMKAIKLLFQVLRKA